MIKISVIMPSLNVRDYIERAVRSVMEQTIREIEIICIDAYSDDGTYEKLQELAAEDGRITVIRTEIRSYGFQVNQGIRIAKGKYIAIVETDDYIDRIMYEQLYGLAEKEQCDYVKGNYTSFWKLVDGEEIFAERKSLAGDELYKGVICPKEYPQAGFGDFYLWTGIYNREFLVDNGIAFSESKGAAYQDIGFLVQTNVKAERVLYLKKSYYYYCADRVGASTNIGRGLQYCYYEFDQMLKWDGYSEKGDWTLLYVRMLQEYYYAINHIDIQAFEDNEEIRQICSWFSEKIQDALKVGLLDYGVFMESQQAKLKLLVRDARQYLQNRQKDIEQYLREIKNPENQFVIFGCGYGGLRSYSDMRQRGVRPQYFVDNNGDLQGQTIGKIKILSPKECREKDLSNKWIYVIADECEEKVFYQLLNLGVAQEHITMYK